ncbi:phage Gp37/Gp68 family protein [Cypionkella sp. TWP1-2-1b2]|uniref:phage Gp37/Gp68 family protein n=1 Tax=Cypionkella sp. TWP1-2-1b2 TaxID=2804675 RepID=UPI003CF54232
MADKSLIEWTDATWNPITGCTLVDDGCRHCYAAHLITSWHAIGNHPSRKGLARKNAAGESKFTGEVRFNEQWLDQPLRWRIPRRIFVCAHGDLFHPAVPDEWIDKVFAVMALASQHTFQVLTKRPERAREYLARHDGRHPAMTLAALMAATGRWNTPALDLTVWPLPNVWLGTSISDQASADLRIPELLACPAAIRFISAEPLLGPVDLTEIAMARPDLRASVIIDALRGTGGLDEPPGCLHWVIVGGESGHHARPMHPDWARSLRDQCVAAGVPFLFKQWGEWAPYDQITDEDGEALYHPAPARHPDASRRCKYDSLSLSGGNIVHPMGKAGVLHNVHPRAFSHPRSMSIFRVGKKRAGRKLDGVEWSQFPEVKHG